MFSSCAKLTSCVSVQFYRCFLALMCCEEPRSGSSMKSSSKVATKAVKGVTPSGQRRTDFLHMVASLGRPAATIPQLGPSFEATNDLTKGPSSDINKPVVVSLEAYCEGWSRTSQSTRGAGSDLRGSAGRWRDSVVSLWGDEPVTQVNLRHPKDNTTRSACRGRGYKSKKKKQKKKLL